MTEPSWAYPPELLEVLGQFGFRPTAATPPARVREALHDLYRYELRRVRDRYRAGVLDKPAYLDRVIALRKLYWPLTLQLPAWEAICKVDR